MITTRVTSPFGFESTAAEVIAGLDLHGRRALVTGAASGIGVVDDHARAGPIQRAGNLGSDPLRRSGYEGGRAG